jgi:hypothetical protein
MASNLSALTSAVSVHGPYEYDGTSYYNGITRDSDHPGLIYHSDFLTTSFPKPIGRYAHIPVKSLNGVWDAVGPQVRDLIKARKINWSSIDPARFFTHAQLGEEAKGSLGPIVIWVGVIPGSTSADTAHEVSQEILTLLRKRRTINFSKIGYSAIRSGHPESLFPSLWEESVAEGVYYVIKHPGYGYPLRTKRADHSMTLPSLAELGGSPEPGHLRSVH